MEKDSRNLGILTLDELNNLKTTNVLVIGVGGLGGYLCNSLARLGVERITIIDYDLFDESNLNRQLFASTLTINESKVAITKSKLLEINPKMKITTFHTRYDNSIDQNLFDAIDIVFDAVDNIETKLLIETHCTLYNKPLIHGAIGGWYGQVGIILPASFLLKEIYETNSTGLEKSLKSPTFIPGIVGNMMISEFIKFSLGKKALVNKILFIDVLEHEYRIIYKK